jgi:hypothetical protein
LSVLAACARGEPPSPASASATVAPIAPIASTAGRDASSVVPDAAAVTADAAAAGTSGMDATPGVDPATLPQTRDKPEPSGTSWDARVAALWSAIQKDDPDLAMPFFFPVAAYEQVKDVANPARDWKYRLVAAYAKDVHDLHAKLGKAADGAKLVKLEPGPAPRWVEPHEEWNKIGYWRVYGSKLRFERADGTSSAFDVKSLISWRGEWFIVHLGAVK